MLSAALLALIQAAPAAPPPPAADTRLARMAALYDEVCLRTFPDDAAVDRLMAAKGAIALTAAEVRVTLVDDPGRGWRLTDGDQKVLVFLELPPYHACSVRWNDPAGPVDLAPYRAVAARYQARFDGWLTLPPMRLDRGDVHVEGTSLARLSDAGSDALMVVEQTPADPARRAAGDGGVDRRFVHQIRER